MPLIIIILALIGAGGAAVASDSARPGDLLFPIDRSIEDIRFALTPEKGRAELKIKFVEERLDEIESILEEEGEDESGGDTDDVQATSTQSSGVSEEARQNLSQALDILTAQLAEVRGAASTTPGIVQAIGVIEERLQSNAGALPQELRIRIRDGRGRIELRTEDEKIKVKIKDGEIEVEIKSEDDDDDDDDSDNKGPSVNSGSGEKLNPATSSAVRSDDDNDDDSVSSDDDGDSSINDEDENDDSDDDDDDDDDSDESGGNRGPGSSGSSN